VARGARHARRDVVTGVVMRSLAERANLLATPSGFWKRELRSANPIAGVSVARPFAHTARDPCRVTAARKLCAGPNSQLRDLEVGFAEIAVALL
jgi:hypothetical protein